MAKGDGKTLESLYIELGLDISKLQADILAADKTVTENLGRINREKNTIKLRVEADIAALDRVKDATKILEIQENGLNQQLSLSRDKLAILEAAYKQVANNTNSTVQAVQRAEQAWQKQRIEVAQLEQALKSLSAQKISIDTSQLQNKISQLDGKIKNVRLKAEIDVSQLKEAGNIFDAQKVHIFAVTKELELQRQKLIQLRETMYQSARNNGGDSFQTINIKTNVLEQMRQISLLETKLKSLQNNNINLQIRADSIKQAEQNINDNIARINAMIEHIKVKTDIDVSKLGSLASEFDKAKAHVQGLNRELDLQNQKLAEMRKAFATSVGANGLNNVKTINLSTEIQKQIQAIDQLKAKINELNKIEPPKTNGLLSGYLNIKGDVTGKLQGIMNAFSNLRGATSSADSAVTSVLNVIGEIPHPVGRAAAALMGLPLIFKGIENSIVDMTRAAAASGDAVYVMSRGMQMSTKDAGKFSTNAKVAGTDVNSLATAIKQVQRQIVRGGDDSRASEWLKKYGESARDANGNLKNLNDMTFSLSRALHKAQEEGKGVEFVFSVFRNISADDITAIEDWISVNKQAATIVKNGLANPALAHEVKGNLNALAVQEGQLKASFESALLPVANEIVPRITERMGKLTQVIADNKDVIKELGNDLASIWGGVETVVDKIGDGVGVIGGVIKDVYMAKANAENRLIERYKNDTNVKTAEDLLQRELSRGYTPQDRAAIEATPYLYEQELKKYEPIIKAIQDAREEIKKEKKALSDEIASVAEISSVAADRRAVEENPELLKQAESLKKILQETSDIQYKLSHTDYENKKLDVLQWQQDILNQAEMTEEKRVAIEKLGAAKLAQIEQERADKLTEIRASIEATDKTALQNKLDTIEKERQAWIKAGMDEAEATELAQRRIAKARQDVEQEMATVVQSLQQTALEQRLSQIDKEKQAWIDKCNDEVKATQWAEQAKMDAQRNAAMQVIKQQAKEYEAYQQGGLAGLQAYKMADLAKSGVNLDYLNMTPQQLQQFQQANQLAEKGLMPQFMTDTDRAFYQQQMQQSYQRLKDEYDKDNYAIVNGQKMTMSEALGGVPIKISLDKDTQITLPPEAYAITDGQKTTMNEAINQLTQAMMRYYETDNKGNLAAMSETQLAMPAAFDEAMGSFSDLPQTVQCVVKTFAEIPPAVQSSIESLNEFPAIVQGISESLTDLTQPQFAEIENPFANLEPEIASVIGHFSNMTAGVKEVTIKLSDLQTAIANLKLNRENSEQTTRMPVNINVTVEIKEAHAWDSEHIQELSDRVADEIQPVIVGAIGGDSNSY